MAPQLYWNLDTKAAPSRSLAKWWSDNANGVDVYIGQDVKRTMDVADPRNNDRNELDTKVRLSRELPNVQGNMSGGTDIGLRETTKVRRIRWLSSISPPLRFLLPTAARM